MAYQYVRKGRHEYVGGEKMFEWSGPESKWEGNKVIARHQGHNVDVVGTCRTELSSQLVIVADDPEIGEFTAATKESRLVTKNTVMPKKVVKETPKPKRARKGAANEKKARAFALLDQGLDIKAVAAEMGITVANVRYYKGQYDKL